MPTSIIKGSGLNDTDKKRPMIEMALTFFKIGDLGDCIITLPPVHDMIMQSV